VVLGVGCLCAQVRMWGNVCVKFQFAFVCDWVKIFQFYTLQPLTLVFWCSVVCHLFRHVTVCWYLVVIHGFVILNYEHNNNC